jgi:phosphonate degradation associated HDIG domain protein
VTTAATDPISKIFDLFASRGDQTYFGERISQTDHALQTAWLARQEGADPALIAAALLHDIGHLLHGLSEDVADQGKDAHHESIGAAWLSNYFEPQICKPIKLHVAAKRYLCFVDPEYRRQLSPSSIQSLDLQGGPLDAEAARKFRANRFARKATMLRRWDDRAKVVGLKVPPLEEYRRYLEDWFILHSISQPGGRLLS